MELTSKTSNKLMLKKFTRCRSGGKWEAGYKASRVGAKKERAYLIFKVAKNQCRSTLIIVSAAAVIYYAYKIVAGILYFYN